MLDVIHGADGTTSESIGGPACYGGLTARRFGFNVSLATRIGSDFPPAGRKTLQENDLVINDQKQVVDAATTRFGLVSGDDSRRLVLETMCDPLTTDEIREMNVDCWLASPVFDEVPLEVLNAIKESRGKKDFVMLDPQGYLRRVDGKRNGPVTLLEILDLDLTGITAIKVDSQEMAALTAGLQGVDGMRELLSRGVRFVVSTEHRVIHLYYEKMHYWIKLNDIDTPDSTGAGDILSAAFCCAYLKEKDPLWAICFGAGAVQAALETKQVGLAKIPPKSKIEESASYFYNTVGFKKIS